MSQYQQDGGLDRCRLCGDEEDLDFHHWKYEGDVGCPLCRECHSYIHEPDGGRPGETAGNEWLETAFPRLVDRHLKYNQFLSTPSLLAKHYNIPQKHHPRVIEIVEEKNAE